MNPLAEHGAALLHGELALVQPLHGGDLSQVMRIRLADGREAVVKSGPAPRVEAAMLAAIAQAGAPAPHVLAADDQALALEVLPHDGGPAWADLGRAVRVLHAAAGDRYGWADDYGFGAVVIPGGWTGDWPGFWAEKRLLACAPHVPADIARRLERLAARLPGLLPARPTPALLHGDLWGGNVLAAGGRVSGLIDPACCFGHAEVDLAMLRMFDAPAAAFRAAYGPPEPGEDERRPIYQLWPALVHLRLFGAGYLGLVERLLAAAGA